MGYSVMTIEEEAKDFIVALQKEKNFKNQSQAIYLLRDLYNKKRVSKGVSKV